MIHVHINVSLHRRRTGLQELFISLQSVRGIRPHFCPVMQIQQPGGGKTKFRAIDHF